MLENCFLYRAQPAGHIGVECVFTIQTVSIIFNALNFYILQLVEKKRVTTYLIKAWSNILAEEVFRNFPIHCQGIAKFLTTKLIKNVLEQQRSILTDTT